MNTQSLIIPSIFILAVTSISLLAAKNWRIIIALLSFQYLAIFFLLQINWSIQLAATNLLAGWIAGAILGIGAASFYIKNTDRSNNSAEKKSTNVYLIIRDFAESGMVFQLLAGGLAILAISLAAPLAISVLTEIRPALTISGLILAIMGVLKLGFTDQIFPTIIGLVTTFSGFILIYSSLEQSVLVAGLLAVVILGIALTGTYLMNITAPDGGK